LRPHEFWELTCAEFDRIAEGHKHKQRNHINEILFLAWHTEALARMPKLPSLNSLLYKNESSPSKKIQTPEEMISICKLLNVTLGGVEKET